MHVAAYVLALLVTGDLAAAELEVFRSHCLRTGMFQASEEGKYTFTLLDLTLKDDVFLSVTQAYSDKVKKNPRAPNRSRTYVLPISTSDALPLSYRRLVVARPLNWVHVTNILHTARIEMSM